MPMSILLYCLRWADNGRPGCRHCYWAPASWIAICVLKATVDCTTDCIFVCTISCQTWYGGIGKIGDGVRALALVRVTKTPPLSVPRVVYFVDILQIRRKTKECTCHHIYDPTLRQIWKSKLVLLSILFWLPARRMSQAVTKCLYCTLLKYVDRFLLLVILTWLDFEPPLLLSSFYHRLLLLTFYI